MSPLIDVEAVLRQPPFVYAQQTPSAGGRREIPDRGFGEVLGQSRAGRPIHGHQLGTGPSTVSLIAGCHADEPVGPGMLARLTAWLNSLAVDHPALGTCTWHLVPHANPDGAAANAAWSEGTIPISGTARAEDNGDAPPAMPATGYDLADFLTHARREAPGDDIEFGFPKGPGDDRARPENLAIAAFLRSAAPLHLHASFHGMAFAAGPWFLLEPAWIDRTSAMRDAVRAAVKGLGYRPHDIDRHGDKGFTRIDAGFTTRPNADAMSAHFRALGDDETAAHFRPSSMDFVRALGGDPLTLVSEMPLFLTPPELYDEAPVRPPALETLAAAAHGGREAVDRRAAELGIRPMPIEDQMRLQLIYLDAALDAVTA